MKKVIRYLRFSNLGQSNCSIEAQELCTDQWISFNNGELIDTFIDVGKSAKTFDRPDFMRLQKFVSKYYKTVDYLLVDQMDRFSRNAGEALTMIKDLQKKYRIQVVSVTEGITFDYEIPGSFFRTGLQFLLAEEENINRSIKIRKGLYTAKAKEGRFLGNVPPFGYKKNGIGKERHLIIENMESEIVKFIYKSYLKNVPLYVIEKEISNMGFNRKGNVAVEKILKNPVYAGMLRVESFRELPGGLFPGIHEPIIGKDTWRLVQNKIIEPKRTRIILDEELPLRGILKCHCGNALTGAPSRGKSGKYFYYYKCKFSGHNNLSALKIHDQFLSIVELISFPEKMINEIIRGCQMRINKEVKSKRLKIITLESQLKDVERKLSSLEEKWIVGEINKKSFEKWDLEYNEKIIKLRKSIEKLNYIVDKVIDILGQKLNLLIDVKDIFNQGTLLQKRELVKMLFDNNLYYRDGLFLTSYIIKPLRYNLEVMKDRGLYII
jgi:site-specific DNA recombinase